MAIASGATENNSCPNKRSHFRLARTPESSVRFGWIPALGRLTFQGARWRVVVVGGAAAAVAAFFPRRITFECTICASLDYPAKVSRLALANRAIALAIWAAQISERQPSKMPLYLHEITTRKYAKQFQLEIRVCVCVCVRSLRLPCLLIVCLACIARGARHPSRAFIFVIWTTHLLWLIVFGGAFICTNTFLNVCYACILNGICIECVSHTFGACDIKYSNGMELDKLWR